MSNCKPKMANSLRRVLLIATMVTGTILAVSCEAQDDTATSSMHEDGPQSSNGPVDSNPGVLPVPQAEPGESGMVDVNNQAVTGGIASFVTPLASPFTWTIYEVLDFFLRNFVGQKLPCTIWSITPPKVECTYLEGPSM